jgi:hypothetical protein
LEGSDTTAKYLHSQCHQSSCRKLVELEPQCSWRFGEKSKKIKKELEECRRAVIGREKVAREDILRYKLQRLEEQVDIYWKQRAHVNWLQKGDPHTSFFMWPIGRGGERIGLRK